MTRIKLNLTMGDVLAAAGLLMRALQISFMSFGVRAAADSMVTLVVTCITVGGFSVIASELRGRGAVFSLLCAAFMLCGIMNVGSLRTLGFFSMFLTFASFVLLLCAMPRDNVRLIFAVVTAVLSVIILMQAVGALSLPTVLISAFLSVIYVSMGAGLIL